MRHIAVGVIERSTGEVLVSQRPPGVPLGGLWEFPGGKVERGEAIRAALARELEEEIGLKVTNARPLIRIPHRDPDYPVLLDVWRVEGYRGDPYGREGQRVEWVPKEALYQRPFPVANRPIIKAVNLPAFYLITPEPSRDPRLFLAHLERLLTGGVRLVQLRAKTLAQERFRKLAVEAIRVCRANGARILLNAAPALARELGADGVHLSAARLASTASRPLPEDMLVAASCHDSSEVAQAARIGADFAVVSPVKTTASHRETAAIGWSGLQALTERAQMPVYALGGMTARDLTKAWNCGAQGVAAISGLWGSESAGETAV